MGGKKFNKKEFQQLNDAIYKRFPNANFIICCFKTIDEIENKIFLPIFISNSKIYLNEFKGFLLNLERKIKPLKVINHPQMQN